MDSLSSFYNYLEAEEIVPYNPMRKVDRIKEDKVARTFLNAEEVRRLLYVVDNWKVISQVRNQALIRVFLYTGLRVTELCLVNWDDVDFQNRTIVVRKAKGNKCSVIYMNDEFWSANWAR